MASAVRARAALELMTAEAVVEAVVQVVAKRHSMAVAAGTRFSEVADHVGRGTEAADGVLRAKLGAEVAFRRGGRQRVAFFVAIATCILAIARETTNLASAAIHHRFGRALTIGIDGTAIAITDRSIHVAGVVTRPVDWRHAVAFCAAGCPDRHVAAVEDNGRAGQAIRIDDTTVAIAVVITVVIERLTRPTSRRGTGRVEWATSLVAIGRLVLVVVEIVPADFWSVCEANAFEYEAITAGNWLGQESTEIILAVLDQSNVGPCEHDVSVVAVGRRACRVNLKRTGDLKEEGPCLGVKHILPKENALLARVVRDIFGRPEVDHASRVCGKRKV